MSTTPQPKPNGKANGKANAGLAQMLDMEPNELMRAMGGNGWFNPLSNDMIKWPFAAKDDETVPPTVYRMYAWMVWHHCAAGNRQPFANYQGEERHLSHMMRDLNLEGNNCRAYWRWGVVRGLWRNGTQEEGAKRLYLLAEVKATVEAEPSEVQNGYVHTRFSALQKLPPYMQEQINRLPENTIAEIEAWYRHHLVVSRVVEAELAAARRMVLDEIEDTKWRELGIDGKIRLGARMAQTPQEQAAAAERRRLLESLRPHLEGYVHTRLASVQIPKTGTDIPEKDSVHSPDARPSLLGLDSRPLDSPAGGRTSNAPSEVNGQSQLHDGEKSVQVHRPPEPPPKPVQPEEHQAAITLLQKLAAVQQEHPKRFAGEKLNPANKGDLATAAKIVRAIGIPNVDLFSQYIAQRAVERRGMGHQLTFALVSEMTGDFERAAPDLRRRIEREQKQADNRALLQAAADESNRRAIELEKRTRDAWQGMPEEERNHRLAAAEAEMRRSPQWAKQWRDNPTARKKAREDRAYSALMRELEAEQAKEAAAGGKDGN